MYSPEITKRGALNMQVCVPENWTDNQVEYFANTQNPAGTTNGWHIQKQGHELLEGADERVSCIQRKGFVHIMLAC
jgi:hypothetical protein